MEDGMVPNASNQQLVVSADSDSATTLLHTKSSRTRESLREVTFKEYMMIGILCFVNLINYMDRFTIAGVLSSVQKDFDIGDDYAGLLQTVFVIAYMIFAPVFGYLGDRHSRRLIMAFGVGLWSLTTFLGSFVKNYTAFAFFRGFVGIGEASYSTIAPTIISDLFVGNIRSKMLAMFYFAIPVGSGMGYIVGSVAGGLAQDWRWGLRVTPMLGVVAVVLIMWVMEDPPRGHAEDCQMQATSYKKDIKSLLKTPSFVLVTLSFTCVCFVTGALAWWGPQFIYLGFKLQPDNDLSMESVSVRFGAVCMSAGALGVPLGATLAGRLRARARDADPAMCGLALLASAPLVYLALVAAAHSAALSFPLVFLGMLTLNLTWSVVADIVLYVVIPPRRSTAEAVQILFSHMLGDAGSPYLVGLISEAMKGKEASVSDRVQFQSLQYALFITCFVEVLGGVLFLLASMFVVRDRNKVDTAIAESDVRTQEPSHAVAHEVTTQPTSIEY